MRALLSGIAVAGLLLGCDARQRTPADTIVVLLGGAPKTVDPRYVVSEYEQKVSQLVAAGLTTSDTPNAEPRLLLAESLEPVDDLVWQARLSPLAYFSDGTRVTSKDVKYTLDSAMAPGSPKRGHWKQRLERVEVVDEQTVRLFLPNPNATFESDLGFGILSKRAGLEGRIIGAGPFAVASFTEGDILLERNPHYRLSDVSIAKLRIRAVKDEGARNLMLVGGSADLAQNSVRQDLLAHVEKRSNLTVVTGPSTILSYLLMNNNVSNLSDKRVRQAIAHAINRPEIIRNRFSGHAVVASGLVPPSHWAYSAQVATYKYDPQRARELLDAAGYPDPDGPGGQPRFELTYKTSSNPFYKAVARAIAISLGEVGIAVEVRPYEFHTLIEDLKKNNYELASMQSPPINDPDYYYGFYHSSKIPTAENKLFGYNRWHYRNERVDELVTLGRTTMTRSQRIPVYAELQSLLAEDLPMFPLWHEDNIVISSREVEGYQMFPTAGMSGLARAKKVRSR